MVDALAVYGAVTASAGLLGVAYQAWGDRARDQDIVDITVALSDQRKTGFAHDDIEGIEFGVAVWFVNRSKHSIHVNGGGVEQQLPRLSDCAVFLGETEVGPRRSNPGFFIPQWWIDSEEIDLSQPVRGFVSLEDGNIYRSAWTVLRPMRASRSA